MEIPRYTVQANTEFLGVASDDAVRHRFTSVEIMPPVPKAVAELACKKIIEYIEERIGRGARPYPEAPGTELTADGFCDEGATVNTVLRFARSRSFTSDPAGIDSYVHNIQRVVENVLSPSGIAIADK